FCAVSEGMLAVVTEATLKLLPLPPFRACLAIGYAAMQQAINSLHAIFEAGILPCALEVADSFTLAAAYRRTGSQRLKDCGAHLSVELDGKEASVRQEINVLEQIIRRQNPRFIQKGVGAAEVEAVWK